MTGPEAEGGRLKLFRAETWAFPRPPPTSLPLLMPNPHCSQTPGYVSTDSGPRGIHWIPGTEILRRGQEIILQKSEEILTHAECLLLPGFLVIPPAQGSPAMSLQE